MQFYALSNKGVLCSALDAKRQIDYFCVECQSVVRVRGGHHKRIHFYHLDKSPSCRLNGKSLTHLEIQHHIQNLFSKQDVCLEEPFPTIGRIADCAHHGKKWIFEIQCSFITAIEVKERTMDYNSLGYNVIWIFHEKQFNRRRLTGAEVYLRGRPHFYTNIDAEGKGLIYDQKIKDVGIYRIHRSPPIPINLLTLELPAMVQKKSLWQRLISLFCRARRA